MMTNEKLTELKNLIKMSYDDINNMVADFEDTAVCNHLLLSALDIVAELAVINKAELKLSCITVIVAIELRSLIECAYNDANDRITNFEDTEVHAYLLSALDLVNEKIELNIED